MHDVFLYREVVLEGNKYLISNSKQDAPRFGYYRGYYIF